VFASSPPISITIVSCSFFALRLGMPVLSSAARKWLPYGFAWAHKSEDERELGRNGCQRILAVALRLLMWVVCCLQARNKYIP